LDIKHIKDNIRFQVFVKDEASAGRYALYGQPDDVVKRLCSPMTLKDLIVELLFHPIRFIKQFQS
jgi:hypothetical protein